MSTKEGFAYTHLGHQSDAFEFLEVIEKRLAY